MVILGAIPAAEERRTPMTTQEVLRFAGGVLGPALIAQAMTDLLRAAPELQFSHIGPSPADSSAGLLAQVFPNGLEL